MRASLGSAVDVVVRRTAPRCQDRAMSAYQVDSEIGQLRKVLLHCPDLELTRLTPANIADMLFDEAGRKELLDRVVTVDAFGAGLAPELRAWFDSLDAARLVTYLIGGVIPEDLPFRPEGLVGAGFHPTTFVLPPLP